jgi:creatinine amidohydrolase/Fe(II)-dependent formamide hydrolase-like protein
MLLIEPELVDLAAAPPRANQPAFTWDSGDLLRSSPVTLYRSSADVAETGVFGEPRTASLAKGKAISEVVTAQLVALVRSLREAPTSASS